MRFTVLRGKAALRYPLTINISLTSKLYYYNTSIGNQYSMFRTPIDGFFPDFLRAQNMV